MMNHGLSTGALFLLVGLLYERTHTRLIADYGGIAKVVPGLAVAFFVILLSSIGLPGTNGFIGEFLILSGTFLAPRGIERGELLGAINTPLVAAVAGLGVVLGAVYMLTLYQRVMLGPVRHPERRSLPDLSVREWFTVVPLMVAVVAMGVAPQPFLDRLRPSADRYVRRATAPGGQAPPLGASAAPIAVNAPSAPPPPAAPPAAAVQPVIPAEPLKPTFLPRDVFEKMKVVEPRELQPQTGR
jgi:NADH-quinone oxidoreductase subunit M